MTTPDRVRELEWRFVVLVGGLFFLLEGMPVASFVGARSRGLGNKGGRHLATTLIQGFRRFLLGIDPPFLTEPRRLLDQVNNGLTLLIHYRQSSQSI